MPQETRAAFTHTLSHTHIHRLPHSHWRETGCKWALCVCDGLCGCGVCGVCVLRWSYTQVFMMECVFVWRDEAVCGVCVFKSLYASSSTVQCADITSCCLVGKILFWVSTQFICLCVYSIYRNVGRVQKDSFCVMYFLHFGFYNPDLHIMNKWGSQSCHCTLKSIKSIKSNQSNQSK